MNTDQWENKIIHYFEGELSELEIRLLHDAVETDATLSDMYLSYEKMYTAFDSFSPLSPPEDMKGAYATWLTSATATPKHKKTKVIPLSSLKIWTTIAASLVVGILFWNIERNAPSPTAALESAIAQELRSSSTTDRIRAIRVAHSTDTNESEIINVLKGVLENDDNSHVRLAAVGTLSSYMHVAEVRALLIRHLAHEESGIVKLEILSALEGQDTDQTIKTFENIAEDDSQEPFVKDKAHMHLIRYNQSDI